MATGGVAIEHVLIHRVGIDVGCFNQRRQFSFEVEFVTDQRRDFMRVSFGRLLFRFAFPRPEGIERVFCRLRRRRRAYQQFLMVFYGFSRFVRIQRV